ncbi:hypothetical protein F7725_012609 [Dissostichus mawsoni]|uniref:Iron-sulfur cluster assembly enzyme ISCU n=1 Tax=Dissostichus mawsoni TaxID=36200 RepID=A0A7J5YR10_DISMA|nr:hypothetical protein F7725_012609 [Dissostichus mawsoni]
MTFSNSRYASHTACPFVMVLVFFRAHSLVSVHHHRSLNMAVVSLRNSASSLLLFSRRLFSPELKAQCLYHIKVVDHYENPRNVGTLDKNSKNVGTGLVGAPACGDVMKLQIEVDDHGMIVDAKFKTFGCGSAIASSSLATEWVKGKSVEEALKIRNTDIAKELCLPPVKLHCSMLAEDAIKAALSDYRIKQQDKKEKRVQATDPTLSGATCWCRRRTFFSASSTTSIRRATNTHNTASRETTSTESCCVSGRGSRDTRTDGHDGQIQKQAVSEMDRLATNQVCGHPHPASQQPAVEIQDVTLTQPEVVGEVHRSEARQPVERALWDRAQAVAVDLQDLQVDQSRQRGQVQDRDANQDLQPGETQKGPGWMALMRLSSRSKRVRFPSCRRAPEQQGLQTGGRPRGKRGSRLPEKSRSKWSTLHSWFLATERAAVLRGTERGSDLRPRDSHRTRNPGQQQPGGQGEGRRQARGPMQRTRRT